MRRKLITVILLFLSAAALYSTNKITTNYYSRNFYNVSITADKTDVVLGKDDESAIINVSLVNNSRKFITNTNNVFLAYHIVDRYGNDILYDSLRYNFPDIKPFNKQEAIPVTVLNINKPGEYILQLDMVEEGVTWFSQKGNPMYEINLQIND